MKILLINDLIANVEIISDTLKAAGYNDLFSVSTLDQALKYIGTSLDSDTPVDLILLDLDIHDTNGIGALLTIKSHRTFEDIPIIALTANKESGILDRAFAAGASDYIVTPICPIELRARVRSALQLRREMLKRMFREQELEHLARRLERMTNLDGLTGIANRRCFDDTLVREWVRNGRDDRPIGLLMIDIDHFKKYNDSLGHVVGDTCLCSVARAIQAATHRPGDLVARYGGEEFAIILPNTDYEGACSVAEAIHTNLAKCNLHHPCSHETESVTVSIGVSSGVPNCSNSPEHLLKAADNALYLAKQSGRNRTKSVNLPRTKDIRQ
ncbi:GGDEF domain-containing response regulator [Pseudodesulfovibrio sediminis]|uniref:diguanylate cyclase n=1 Tax=Pseudodesulfovibrio sediminis TaxID=2810563 RepID=A0ABM7P5Z9_9BACT|nr:diguanylate cyclase [Pseudodesulfovibrio sediminis]BCS88286.1 diguanylate cyclase response regulator [Pseudodesulfovibrio sediminis]